MPKNIRKRKESSSSSSSEDEAAMAAAAAAALEEKINIKEKIEELKFIQKQREKTHGLDVYSLAIGNAAENAAKAAARRIDNDPWKTKTGGLVDMREIKERQEQRGNEIVRNMNANYVKETNQRDEDAEMQKFIEQELKKMRQTGAGPSSSSLSEGGDKEDDGGEKKKYVSPNDVIFDLPKQLLELGKKKQTGDDFTEEIVSGIPEVDLGIDELMRNIEETEKAKAALIKSRATAQQEPSSQYHHNNHRYHHHHQSKKGDNNASFTSSVNFVQHKRFDESLINVDKQRAQQMAAAVAAADAAELHKHEPVVGNAPKHTLLQQQQQRPATYKRKDFGGGGGDHHLAKHHRPNTGVHPGRHGGSGGGGGRGGGRGGGDQRGQPFERASDDYCVEKFKKNMRFSRTSKIKIS